MATAQQNSPELHVGSNVYTRNGEKIGRLRFMVVNPDTASVSHLVLEKGMMLASDALAPVNSVGRVLHRGIFLNLSAEDVAELPEFAEGRYLQHQRGDHDGGGNERGGGGGGGGGGRHGGGGGGGGGRRGKGRYRRHRDRGHDRD
ncbi:MAG: PRC-barrel domain-containing protein [Vulcanimicrobiota bacterium]